MYRGKQCGPHLQILLNNVCIEAISVDHDQTAQSDLGLHCLLERLLKHLADMNKTDNIHCG